MCRCVCRQQRQQLLFATYVLASPRVRPKRGVLMMFLCEEGVTTVAYYKNTNPNTNIPAQPQAYHVRHGRHLRGGGV